MNFLSVFFSKPICPPFLLSEIPAVVLSASFDSSNQQGLPAPVLVIGPHHIKAFQNKFFQPLHTETLDMTAS